MIEEEDEFEYMQIETDKKKKKMRYRLWKALTNSLQTLKFDEVFFLKKKISMNIFIYDILINFTSLHV